MYPRQRPWIAFSRIFHRRPRWWDPPIAILLAMGIRMARGISIFRSTSRVSRLLTIVEYGIKRDIDEEADPNIGWTVAASREIRE